MPNHYIQEQSSTSGTNGNYINIDGVTVSSDSTMTLTGSSTWESDSGVVGYSMNYDNKKGIHPELYFKYIKRKFKTLERIRMDARLKRLEKAFNEAIDNGQEALGEKMMTQFYLVLLKKPINYISSQTG